MSGIHQYLHMEQKFQFEIAAILTEEIADVKKISDNKPTEQFTSCLVIGG
jgi:hypothetical protein